MGSTQGETQSPGNPKLSIDDVIEGRLQNLSWSQLLQAILVSLAWVFDVQQVFISIFTDAMPKTHCLDRNYNASSSSNITCKHASSSIISEWALENSGSTMTSLPSSSFFVGCFLGSLALPTLADSALGRKKLLFLSTLTMSVSALLTAFSIDLWMYSALRFVTGFGRASIGTCAIVLVAEKVGKQRRGRVSVMGFLLFSLGFLSLPAIAYVNRGYSWRILYVCTSIPGILYSVLVLFFVYESPRWLFLQHRFKDAIFVLQKMAPSEHSSLNAFTPESLLTEMETKKVDFYTSIKILFGKRWVLRRLISVVIVSFGVGMVYYGIPLGIGNFGFNLYLSVAFNALIEVPSYVITFLFIEKWNRRTSLLISTISSGIFSVICTALARSGHRGVQIGLELASFFCAITSYNILVVFTVELFPTCVRNSATSTVRQAQVFGAVCSPLLVSLGRKKPMLSFGVFGFVIMGCGLFTLCLPETRGSALSDTVDEQTEKDGLNA